MHHRSPTRALLVGAACAFALTACGGGGGDTSDAAAAESTVTVTAGDMFFDPTDVSADAGTIGIELDNEGAMLHNLVLEEGGKVAEADAGASDSGTVELEAGTYTFYCDVPGHREAGMEGTLEVS